MRKLAINITKEDILKTTVPGAVTTVISHPLEHYSYGQKFYGKRPKTIKLKYINNKTIREAIKNHRWRPAEVKYPITGFFRHLKVRAPKAFLTSAAAFGTYNVLNKK